MIGRKVAIRTPLSAAFATLLAITACATAPHGNADPTQQQSPFPTGKSGTSIHVTEYSTATADVTLNNANWISSGCSSTGGGCNVIEFTIVGKSDTPFSYSEKYLTAASTPWKQDPYRDIEGGSSTVDYQAINKTPPLRSGTVTNGQTAHGFIGYGSRREAGRRVHRVQRPERAGGAHPISGLESPHLARSRQRARLRVCGLFASSV